MSTHHGDRARSPQLQIILTLAAAGLLLLLFNVAGCLSGTISRHQAFIAEHVRNNSAITDHELQIDGFHLHYRSAGHAREAIALWIHGTPGSWADIGRLMIDTEFFERVLLVSIDRPGWGASQFADRPRLVPTFAEQTRLIEPLLEQLAREHPGVPIVIAGHSWGAPLAATLAAHTRIDVAGVLALAGPFDPELAEPRWYNWAGTLWPITALMGNSLRQANVEMFALPGNLRRSLDAWSSLPVPLVVVRGDTDTLVPAGHHEFAGQWFPPGVVSLVNLADQGHLMQIERTAFISRCIRALAEAVPERCHE